jgi:hypothetical protein
MTHLRTLALMLAEGFFLIIIIVFSYAGAMALEMVVGR